MYINYYYFQIFMLILFSILINCIEPFTIFFLANNFFLKFYKKLIILSISENIKKIKF